MVCFLRSTRKLIPLAIGAMIALLTPTLFAQTKLVEIKKFAPYVVIDLRYATPNNVTGRPLYPRRMRAYAVPSVAQQIAGAQSFLSHYGCRLKIWDAYRPREAQAILWQLAHKGDYVTNPEGGIGSLHSWGVAVDATLADAFGKDLKMPTAFDQFTPEAAMYYNGTDPVVRSHLRLLQVAMAANNFYGLSIEWWHFVSADWKDYLPPEEIEKAKRNQETMSVNKLKAAPQTQADSRN
jgi:D-alanyl-D-alanine dipeptidase